MTHTGIDVWFDEWEIQAGDSIPGKLNEGLGAFDSFVVLWSASANRSNWVRQELNTAITRAMAADAVKIVPCILDDTPLPPLIADRKYVDLRNFKDGLDELLGDLTGTRTRKRRLLAIQEALGEMDVNWITHPMLPPMVCCPRCGETDTLEGWEQMDRRGDMYAGMKCTSCGWNDGGEV